jgi:methyl-accepting chemotaxis protein
MKELSAASINTTRQIALISGANREHSTVAAGLLAQLQDVRQVTDRNVRSARDARGGTTELARQATALADTVGAAPARRTSRGRSTNGRR